MQQKVISSLHSQDAESLKADIRRTLL